MSTSSRMPSRDPLRKQYQALKRSLSAVGYFRRGSLVRRFTFCGKPGCACQASPPAPHGPYYQWTRKVRGKTVTVRLSHEEADLMREWIAMGRQLDRIIARMERLSARATERLLRERAAGGAARDRARPRRKHALTGQRP
jgi:hypothetical protein